MTTESDIASGLTELVESVRVRLTELFDAAPDGPVRDALFDQLALIAARLQQLGVCT